MKRKIEIYQYGSQLDPTGPTRYSPSDWVDISISESSPSERSSSIGAPGVSNSSASDSDAFTSSSASDSDAFWELTSEELLTKISQELQRRMQEFGVDLPSEMTMEYFTCRVVIGEEEAGALDPSFLIDVLSDVQQPYHIFSWYWERAFSSSSCLFPPAILKIGEPFLELGFRPSAIKFIDQLK